MIHIAICDDEPYMSEKIKKRIADFFHNRNTEISILQFSSGEELLLYDRKIDILFLDIQMGKMDGMETARKLRDRRFKGFLIFITVLKEMVFQAFEVQAYDYFVKPIEKKQFEKTMERLFTAIQSAGKTNLLVQRGYERILISLDDILFCEIMNRKVYLHLKSGEVIDYYDKMEHLEKKLDSCFFKCHRSFLINMRYLKSYKNGLAYMENGKEIPVSRLRSKEFSDIILRYMQEWRA